MNEDILSEVLYSNPRLGRSKISNWSAYESNLRILAYVTEECLLDGIERLESEKNRFSKDGFFYSIPYYDSDLLYSDDSIMLMCIYDIHNRSSFCPISITAKLYTGEDVAIIYLNLQYKERTEKKLLCKITADDSIESDFGVKDGIVLVELETFLREYTEKYRSRFNI